MSTGGACACRADSAVESGAGDAVGADEIETAEAGSAGADICHN